MAQNTSTSIVTDTQKHTFDDKPVLHQTDLPTCIYTNILTDRRREGLCVHTSPTATPGSSLAQAWRAGKPRAALPSSRPPRPTACCRRSSPPLSTVCPCRGPAAAAVAARCSVSACCPPLPYCRQDNKQCFNNTSPLP